MAPLSDGTPVKRSGRSLVGATKPLAALPSRPWHTAQKVAKELRVSIAQVYLAKHRIAALLKKEIAAAERAPIS